MRLRLAASAQRDLDEVWLRLAIEASEEIATRTVNNIAGALRRLETFPWSGAPHDELGEGVRSLSHRNYVAYHAVMRDHVLVTRIVHTAQDVQALDLRPPDE